MALGMWGVVGPRSVYKGAWIFEVTMLPFVKFFDLLFTLLLFGYAILWNIFLATPLCICVCVCVYVSLLLNTVHCK